VDDRAIAKGIKEVAKNQNAEPKGLKDFRKSWKTNPWMLWTIASRIIGTRDGDSHDGRRATCLRGKTVQPESARRRIAAASGEQISARRQMARKRRSSPASSNHPRRFTLASLEKPFWARLVC